MTTEGIEKAVEQLPPHQLARFRAWFEAFDANQFDAAIERDARACRRSLGETSRWWFARVVKRS